MPIWFSPSFYNPKHKNFYQTDVKWRKRNVQYNLRPTLEPLLWRTRARLFGNQKPSVNIFFSLFPIYTPFACFRRLRRTFGLFLRLWINNWRTRNGKIHIERAPSILDAEAIGKRKTNKISEMLLFKLLPLLDRAWVSLCSYRRSNLTTLQTDFFSYLNVSFKQS